MEHEAIEGVIVCLDIAAVSNIQLFFEKENID